MRRFLIGAGACLLLAACVPQSQYYWGNYSQALYNYYGDPTKVQDYHQALVEVIAEAGPQNRVPPGLYAELGYLELQAGNESGAKDNFLKEKALWPESAARAPPVGVGWVALGPPGQWMRPWRLAWSAVRQEMVGLLPRALL